MTWKVRGVISSRWTDKFSRALSLMAHNGMTSTVICMWLKPSVRPPLLSNHLPIILNFYFSPNSKSPYLRSLVSDHLSYATMFPYIFGDCLWEVWLYKHYHMAWKYDLGEYQMLCDWPPYIQCLTQCCTKNANKLVLQTNWVCLHVSFNENILILWPKWILLAHPKVPLYIDSTVTV